MNYKSRHSRLGTIPIVAAALLVSAMQGPSAAAPQDLAPVIDTGHRTLTFDWPDLEIGTAEYPQGPTGVTVFRFMHRALGAVDVRGGGPGTVNSDYLRLGYTYPELDTVVFAGGSWYGLETVTAVATALKDDGIRDGNAFGAEPNIALSTGSIIFDFGPRRLNEVYPDKRLAQAAFHAMRPGVFPLGAEGAGRFAETGGYFGCNAHSGQGGAFRQIGKVKIAVFTVVNAWGAITTRDGKLAACYRDPKWPKDVGVSDLMQSVPESRKSGWTGRSAAPAGHSNTTVSLVVTNEKLAPAELQRLAVQVHTSMGRDIQPFSTEFDGDVLYAVTTGDVAVKDGMFPPDLGVVASELMWDAVLDSIPEQPAALKPDPAKMPPADVLRGYAGSYVFSPFVRVRISVAGGKLLAQATGKRDAYAITRKAPVQLEPVSADTFTVPGRYPLALQFGTEGKLVINPGHWAQIGKRSED